MVAVCRRHGVNVVVDLQLLEVVWKINAWIEVPRGREEDKGREKQVLGLDALKAIDMQQ